MKRGINFLALIIAIMLLEGCKKWIAVSPKLVVREEEFFTNETAFQEALNKVYFDMCSPSLYGKEMTWGMVDVLGGVYTLSDLYLPIEYKSADQRNFSDIQLEQRIEAIWNGSYNCIANINNLIRNLDKADASLFSDIRVRDMIKGEALGLRAFLHFDLLRLFGPGGNAPGSELPVMPYVEEYSTSVKPRIKAADVITRALEDLSLAAQLLANDPMVSMPVSSPGKLAFRKVKFNFYAVKALQARVHLWNGNKVQALAAAKAVMNAQPGRFTWVSRNSVLPSGSEKDRVFSTELISSLFIEKLYQYTVHKLYYVWRNPDDINYATQNNLFLSISPEKREEVYEAATAGITDYRNLYLIEVELYSDGRPDLSATVYTKLRNNSSSSQIWNDTLSARMPLLRLSEMYYIAAECLAETDPVQATALLNTVRTHRGILANLPDALPPAEIRNEIRKEYLKEFPCEGQVFFYRKRQGEINDMLPLPKWEIENGH